MNDSITGKEVLLRTSERSTYKRCRLKWYWRYVNRLQPTREKGALKFGRMIHEALACWYVPGRKRGTHPAAAFQRLFSELPPDLRFPQWDEEGNRIDPLTLGVAMLEGYVEKYDKEPHIEIIASEMSFAIDVFDRQGRYLVTYVGTFDSVYRNLETGRFGLFEHKSAKRIEDVEIVSGYGEQGLSYWWGSTFHLRHLKLLKENEWISEVTFNFLKKALPDDRPVNESGLRLNKPKKEALLDYCAANHLIGVSRRLKVEDLMAIIQDSGYDPMLLGEPSQRQPTPLFVRPDPLIVGEDELETINWRIRAEAYEMGLARSGKLPIIKTPTKDCKWDCEFKDACELHEMGADYQSVLDLEFVPWDPYEAHELAEEHH